MQVIVIYSSTTIAIGGFNTYIKHKLQAKHDKDNDKQKKARYEMENAIKTGKAKYRDKFEENLTTNKNIWQGLKAITNYKPPSCCRYRFVLCS